MRPSLDSLPFSTRDRFAVVSSRPTASLGSHARGRRTPRETDPSRGRTAAASRCGRSPAVTTPRRRGPDGLGPGGDERPTSPSHGPLRDCGRGRRLRPRSRESDARRKNAGCATPASEPTGTPRDRVLRPSATAASRARVPTWGCSVRDNPALDGPVLDHPVLDRPAPAIRPSTVCDARAPARGRALPAPTRPARGRRPSATRRTPHKVLTADPAETALPPEFACVKGSHDTPFSTKYL